MCVSNPQVESNTTWGFTYEEVLHRWDIWKKFDIVTRIFGDGKKEEPKAPEPIVNTEATMMALAGLFGPGFMQQTLPVEETKSDGS